MRFFPPLLLTLCLLVPARTSAQDVKLEGTIVVAMNADIRTTNPGVNRDANTDSVMMHIVEGLVGYREDGTPAPLLAQSIDVSADGKIYTFHLREGVHFHNNATLTADDVVWSWHRYLDPATLWTCLSDFDGSRGLKIESVEAADARTVVFRLNRAAPLLLTQMAALPCGASGIVHRDSVNADGSWKNPIGTGPYKLEAWKRGEYIELAAFAGYASRGGPPDGYTGGKTAYAQKVRWLFIRDDAARRVALIKGQIDVLPIVQVSEFAQIRKLPNVVLKSAPLLTVNALLMQTRDPVLADPKFRRALATALDTHAITEIASGGTGVASASMVPATSPYFSATQKQDYGYDLARAKQLLAESSYRGEKIKLVTNRRYPDMYDQSIMIQSMAREAGINLELEVTEWATQLERYMSGNYQLMSYGYSARTDPYLGYDAMLGDKSKSKRKVWDDPKAIALLADAGATADRGERQVLFDKMHALMLEDTPLVVLFCPADVVAIKRDLDGFRPWGIGRERLWNVRRTGAPSAPATTGAFSGFRQDSMPGSAPDSATRSDSGRNTR
jgi:peptide/nickel transport system substrate-binding protein